MDRWPYRTTMSIGKRPRGASEGAEVPQEQLKPLSVTSVIVAAVRPSAATIWGKICDNKVEIMLDSGSSISLIQESIVAPFSDKNKISSSGLQLTSASGDNIPILGCIRGGGGTQILRGRNMLPGYICMEKIIILLSDCESWGGKRPSCPPCSASPGLHNTSIMYRRTTNGTFLSSSQVAYHASDTGLRLLTKV